MTPLDAAVLALKVYLAACAVVYTAGAVLVAVGYCGWRRQVAATVRDNERCVVEYAARGIVVAESFANHPANHRGGAG